MNTATWVFIGMALVAVMLLLAVLRFIDVRTHLRQWGPEDREHEVRVTKMKRPKSDAGHDGEDHGVSL